MKEHKKLIDYLPPFIAEYREYRRLFAALQEEDDSILGKISDSLNDTYVDLATLKGIERWENMLSIVPDSEATLEERRAAIRFRMNITLPYTLKALRKMLDDLVGPGNYYCEMTGEFELTVMVDVASSYMRNAVNTMLAKIIPANIGLTIGIRYVQHLTYNDIYIHGDMSQYDHTYLRTVGIIEPLTGKIIRYSTNYGTQPLPIRFEDSYTLTEEDLPELTED